jgi:RNA 2',3'-cyclic 3'-phosphodiesterase
MNNKSLNDRLRLFVAITIPEPVRNEMTAIERELKPLAQGDVRWVKTEQLHLTLKFLGNIPSDSVAAVKNALAQACAGVGPFHLLARGIGFFPHTRSPRVIWVGFEDDANVLADLQRGIERFVEPFLEKPGAEKFRPHATLGRFQKYRRHKTEQLLPRALALGKHVFGKWRVEGVGLFRSELSPDGARHSPVAIFPLGAKLEAGETF